MDGFPCFADAGCLAVWYGLYVDGVGVMMVEDKEVIVAAAGGNGEASGLIGIGLDEIVAINEQGKDVMGFVGEGRSKVLVDVGFKGGLSNRGIGGT